MTKETLGQLIIDSEETMYHVAKSLLYNDADCADAIQEAIVKAFAKLHTLKDDSYAKTWLIRIVMNECYAIMRKEKKIISLQDYQMNEQETESKDYSDLYEAIFHLPEQVKAGCIIEKINGEEITPDKDITDLLNNKAGKKTLVSLYNPQNKERWEEVVKPVTSGQLNGLLYKRWVKQRAEDVEKWSGGRLGYVHIQSMGDGSFRTVYSDILGKYNNCDGIVIDTRFNGGGRLHEDIEILFSGQKYFTQVVRGREACDMPSRRWNKPSIMLQCEANYSNAHGTPWVYKHQNIGKLVGMPVPGTMTSVSWETLQDPSLVFGIPIIGYRLPDGCYLENTQLEPDVKVANSPETVVKGEDTQLKMAVDELLKEIDSRKK